MAVYFTDKQKGQMTESILELRRIVISTNLPSNRDRAHELLARLRECPVHPASDFAYESDRLCRAWRRLERQIFAMAKRRSETILPPSGQRKSSFVNLDPAFPVGEVHL
jgi:hypothetical protein